MNRYKQNKLKFEKYIHKLRYLQSELNECNYIFDICKKEFSKEFTKSVDKLNKKDMKVINKKDNKMKHKKNMLISEVEDDKPKVIKTLYRKIAFETHPDKRHNKKLNELFNKAEEAYSKNNWFKLIEIASSVGVKLPIPTKRQIRWLKREEKDLYKKIGFIKKSVSWNWYHTKEKELKKQIMGNYVISILGGE